MAKQAAAIVINIVSLMLPFIKDRPAKLMQMTGQNILFSQTLNFLNIAPLLSKEFAKEGKPGLSLSWLEDAPDVQPVYNVFFNRPPARYALLAGGFQDISYILRRQDDGI
jgi:hypothetical protein